MNHNCQNCETPLTEGAAYCYACGQPVASQLQPLAPWLSEISREVLDIDNRAWRSLRALLTRPGMLTTEYLAGRCRSWSSPIRMYLLISLLFFLVLPLIIGPMRGHEPGGPAAAETPVDAWSRAMFLMLPVFALLLKLFYRRQLYAAHLVHAVHLFSAMFISFALLLTFEPLADRYLAALAAQFVVLAYMMTYLVLSLRRVYEQDWPWTVAKFLGLLMIFVPLLGMVIDGASHLGVGLPA